MSSLKIAGSPKLPRVAKGWLLCAVMLSLMWQTSPAQQTFTLSGTVVNSATGEGISHAEVHVGGHTQRVTFTDSSGHFQIEGLPPMQFRVDAQKPGYSAFTDPGSRSHWVQVGPNTSAIVIKLVPQGAIYGRVIDSAGQPIEQMSMRLSARAIREGRARWEARGMAETDDDGHYRFANLMPGTYYVAAGPRQQELELVVSGEKQKTGFGHLYYPGVPDRGSAAPISLNAGQQSEADFSLTPVPVYRVSGTVTGHAPDQGVGFQVLTPAGDDIWLTTQFNMETGVFTLDNVPAGTYVIRASSQAGLQSLAAEATVNVSSDVENVRLALAPMASIPIEVRVDSSTNAYTQHLPPVSVQLVPANPANEGEIFIAPQGGASGSMVINSIRAGSYTVRIQPPPNLYVRSATYGATNPLYDEITVAAGRAYPLEIVLRDDAASLSGTVKSSDGSASSGHVVIVPQPLSKLPPSTVSGSVDSFSLSGLAPGEYLVFAFDNIEGLEYANPDVIESYASQAAHVTLTPNQKAQVSLDLIHVGTSQ